MSEEIVDSPVRVREEVDRAARVGEPAPFAEPVDLALRTFGATVVFANDQLFADRRHLISPGESAWQPGTYGRDGKIYDGWETRRRRDEGNDHAIVRLGADGVVRQVIIDTAWFKGNYPPYASVEAVSVEGYPDVSRLPESAWTPLLERSALAGDTKNTFDVADGRSWTHVRLSIYPDGGVARLRVLGEAVADPRLLTGTVDLAALHLGGRVVGCSDMFYSSAANLIRPGSTATTGEGWETARRRDGGNDWVVFALAGAGRLRRAEIDTTHFTGNSPGSVLLRGIDARTASLDDPHGWTELLPRTCLLPDTVHRFRPHPGGPVVTHVRMDVFPDGGMSRVRLWGDLDRRAWDDLADRWWQSLPADRRADVGAAAGRGGTNQPRGPEPEHGVGTDGTTLPQQVRDFLYG